MEKVEIFGIKVDNLNTREFIEKIFDQKHLNGPKVIFYINANTVNIAFKDKEFKDILNKASIVYTDGFGVVFASKILGRPLKERVNAADFFDEFCKKCIDFDKGIYFLGGRQKMLEDLYINLKNRYSYLRILGIKNGHTPQDEEKDIINEINKLRPNILIVGLGSPKQEFFIFKHLPSLEVETIWTVGGLFNLLSGKIKRAPLLMRRLGLEWLFRLFQEPTRLWRRYLIGNFIFIYRVAKELIKECLKI